MAPAPAFSRAGNQPPRGQWPEDPERQRGPAAPRIADLTSSRRRPEGRAATSARRELWSRPGAGPCGRGLTAPGRPRPPETPRRDPSPPRLARGLLETRAEPVPPSEAAPLSAELPGRTCGPRLTFHFVAQHRGRPPPREGAPAGGGRRRGEPRPPDPTEKRDGLPLPPPTGRRTWAFPRAQKSDT